MIQLCNSAKCFVGTRLKHDIEISKLKGLGNAILGHFSIDQVVIELTEITK